MTLLIVVVVALVLYVVLAYNGMIKLRNRVKEAWSDIDVQLKRRYNLIPNIIETVKGYATHEEGVFTKVTEARAAVMNAHGPAEAASADNMLTQTLKSLFAVVENYPTLKANEGFLKLQEELSSTENKISFSRQFYNDVVMDFNNRIQMFPSNVVAGMFGFRAAEFYSAPETDRAAPKVRF